MLLLVGHALRPPMQPAALDWNLGVGVCGSSQQSSSQKLDAQDNKRALERPLRLFENRQQPLPSCPVPPSRRHRPPTNSEIAGRSSTCSLFEECFLLVHFVHPIPASQARRSPLSPILYHHRAKQAAGVERPITHPIINREPPAGGRQQSTGRSTMAKTTTFAVGMTCDGRLCCCWRLPASCCWTLLKVGRADAGWVYG